MLRYIWIAYDPSDQKKTEGNCMEQYHITGMSCAACQARVEKAVSSVPGVNSCAVSLLTDSMGVEGNADPAAVIKAVTDAGYGASLKSAGNNGDPPAARNYEEAPADTQTRKIAARLIASIVILLPLMYVSMGHMMWNWPLPGFLADSHIAMGICEMLLAGLVMVINQKFFVSGFKGAIRGAPNMDTLVAMGSAASFVYSVRALFAMTSASSLGDQAGVAAFMNEFYFESAAMILVLITVGKLLESISKGRTTDALKALMKLAPKTAVILKDGKEQEVPIGQVKTGDLFVVRPGDNIPVDGIVTEGSSAVNEAALTGESIPVDKTIGDSVSAATGNVSGYMVCKATRVGNDTTLAQIIRMVSDAAATKAPIARMADRVSGFFVPAVIATAAVTFIIWMLTGATAGFSLARAVSVLVISCPCALGLATPVAIMVGNGMGAKHGIMFKTAASLEQTGKTQIAVLDKTGTITEGDPKVTGVYPAAGNDEVLLLRTAFALESRSEHPLAGAVVTYCQGKGMEPEMITDFMALPGNGLTAVLNGESICGGNLLFMKQYAAVDEASLSLADTLADRGETPLFFAAGGHFLGIISVADVIREDSAEAIRQLKNMGIHVVMLTGDNEKTAAAIARQAGVDETIAGVKPDGKEAVIRKLQEYGSVAMIGDGINDAPALTKADTGIAIGAGTDVAIDAADVVLIKSRLSDAAAAVRLSRATLTNIRENLFWAFFYNVIGIPLAAGAYIHAFGWTLNPMIGAAAMSLSSFCVVTNALRLNGVKPENPDKDRPLKNSLGHEPLIAVQNNKEERTMEITVKGMMCAHCEAHVKEALEKLAGVESAAADHEKDLVTINTSGEVAESDIRSAVETAGYEYAGIRK